MKAENAFVENDNDDENSYPEIRELNIISGGCHLYGYMLTPDKRNKKPYPTIITYNIIKSNHSFIGQRMQLTNTVGKWIEENILYS